jgi:hypothetical protein
MADSSINSFMSYFDGGARPHLYRVNISAPVLAQWSKQLSDGLSFLVRATSLPESDIGEIQVPYMGRFAKIPGDRQFNDWTIQLINTQGLELRSLFEWWHELMNSYVGNYSVAANPRALFGTAEVTQLNRMYQPVRYYSFLDIWPRHVSAVDLSADPSDQITETTVQLAFTVFAPMNAINGGININGGPMPVGYGSYAAAGTGGFGFGGYGVGNGVSVGSGQSGVSVGGSGQGTSFGFASGNTAFGVSTGQGGTSVGFTGGGSSFGFSTSK